MNFYAQISHELNQSEFFNSYIRLIETGESRFQITHLHQSARALLIAYTWNKTKRNILVVTTDDVIAEDIWDDLCVLIGRENTHYLPDLEILPYEERSPHYSIRATRLEALADAAGARPLVYVLSIRSFLRWMQPLEFLRKNIISLSRGQEYDPEVLISNVVGMGYEIDYQVTKVYQVARRGGILDIFSPPQQKPVRIEFFGDEIMSIRPFSLATQRSDGNEVTSVKIIPAREISLHDISVDSPVLKLVHEKGLFEGIENYISLLLPKVQIFADYFYEREPVIFWNDFPYVQEEMAELFEQVMENYERAKLGKKKTLIPDPEKLFAPELSLYRIINTNQSVFISQTEFLFPEASQTFTAPVGGMGNLNGDLTFLAQDIVNRQSDKQKVIIQHDNLSQANRMKILLEDYDIRVDHFIGCLHQGFHIQDCGLAVFTDHEIFNRYKQKKNTPRFAPGEALVDYENLKPGDYIVHVDHGIGIFEGLKIVKVDGQDIECLCLRYAEDDRIYVPTFQLQLVSRYVAEEGVVPTIHKLGSKKWENTKNRAKKQIEIVAEDVLKLYAERSKRKGISHETDSPWQFEMESSFIYEETPDQITATREIKQDMENPSPMERLLCGDVGFGKTEVAIRAAFKSVVSGYQVAVLVPTTLLAEQHYRVFRERVAQYPVRIAMFSRFRSVAQMKQDLVALALGEIDIAIGTHRLLSEDVKFKHLGLLIIDEEHRFGVRHKEKLRKLQTNVDTLYMSATPIPRTLNMAMSKLKDISLIQTSPKERLPVRTIVTPRDMQVIKDAIQREIDRGGQVFFIHNRVQSIESVAQELRTILPHVRFVVGHAQMSEHMLENIMDAFVERQFDVLIATTIIENGIDIPNANTIIIDKADTFGLAQLYQMRGRVGRSNRRAYAYLLVPQGTTPEARNRLDALTQYDYLGAGFQVAMRDLEIRGAGAILGTKQSGVIQAIGFNYYNKLLETALDNISSNQSETFPQDEFEDKRQKLKTDIDLYFPSDYIADDEARLHLYRRLNECKNPDLIDDMTDELTDKFGKLPEKAKWLLTYYKLKVLTELAKLQNCQVRNGELILEFKSNLPPSREVIMRFLDKVKEPVRFSTSGSFKIIFELARHGNLSYQSQIERAIAVLSVYVSLQK
jgi:transcription-repair coupling factor (superfamily II helicase)